MKLFTKFTGATEWVEVVGMHKSRGKWIPCVVTYNGKETRPVNIGECIKYLEKCGMEWRVEQ